MHIVFMLTAACSRGISLTVLSRGRHASRCRDAASDRTERRHRDDRCDRHLLLLAFVAAAYWKEDAEICMCSLFDAHLTMRMKDALHKCIHSLLPVFTYFCECRTDRMETTPVLMSMIRNLQL